MYANKQLLLKKEIDWSLLNYGVTLPIKLNTIFGQGKYGAILNRGECTGTSYPAINSKDLASIHVKIPREEAEQEKITNLEEYKKGMMQKLFPKKGESIPELD